MVRPKTTHPTPAELEVLKLLWEHGPLTVRQVMDLLHADRPRGYTTVMSLMNVMYDKKLLTREPDGRAFLYSAKVDEQRTLRAMVGDVLGRAFDGSTSLLVEHLLQQASPTESELKEIRKTIKKYESDQRGE